MSLSRLNETKDYLMTKLRVNASASDALLGNLTSSEINEIPSEDIWRKLNNFLWELSVRFYIRTPLQHDYIIQMLAESGEDNYQLKTWHLKKLYALTPDREDVEYAVHETDFHNSDTIGVRQCATSYSTIELRRIALLRNVYNYFSDTPLQLDDLGNAIPMLQSLIDLMNSMLHESNLNVSELFAAIVTNTTNTANSLENKVKIKLNNLTSEGLALLGPIIKLNANKNKIDYDLVKEFKRFSTMDHARVIECARSYRCEEQIEKYISLLHFHRYFHKDPTVAENAKTFDTYLEDTIQYRNTYCSISKVTFPHFTNRSRLGLFKPANAIRDIYSNATAIVEECAFEDVTPFLYFFDESLRAAPVEDIQLDNSLLFNNSSVINKHEEHSGLARNERDLTILIPMLILLLLLLRNIRKNRRLPIATVEDESDIEAGEALIHRPR